MLNFLPETIVTVLLAQIHKVKRKKRKILSFNKYLNTDSMILKQAHFLVDEAYL